MPWIQYSPDDPTLKDLGLSDRASDPFLKDYALARDDLSSNHPHLPFTFQFIAAVTNTIKREKACGLAPINDSIAKIALKHFKEFFDAYNEQLAHPIPSPLVHFYSVIMLLDNDGLDEDTAFTGWRHPHKRLRTLEARKDYMLDTIMRERLAQNAQNAQNAREPMEKAAPLTTENWEPELSSLLSYKQ